MRWCEYVIKSNRSHPFDLFSLINLVQSETQSTNLAIYQSTNLTYPSSLSYEFVLLCVSVCDDKWQTWLEDCRLHSTVELDLE